MVLIFNLAAGAVVVLAFAVAAGTHYTPYQPYWLVVGFAAMTVIGAALELHPRAAWHPRYFWIIPAWLTGLVGAGLASLDAVGPTAGYGMLAVAGAAFVAVLVHAWLYKAGGTWLAGVVGAGAIATGFQLIGYYRPEWKHPVLYVVNALALIATVVCGVQPPTLEPWSEAWLERQAERYLGATSYRRAALEVSLVNPTNIYSRQRLASYGKDTVGWDALPVWNPRSRLVDRAVAMPSLSALRQLASMP